MRLAHAAQPFSSLASSDTRRRQIKGREFLSWLWIDTGDETVADRAVAVAKEHGCPIRSGRPGYGMPTYVRVAVRDEETTGELAEPLPSPPPLHTKLRGTESAHESTKFEQIDGELCRSVQRACPTAHHATTLPQREPQDQARPFRDAPPCSPPLVPHPRCAAYLIDAWKEAFLGIVRRSRAV